MDLSRLAGNAPLKRQLELETARRGLSHAYILSGQRGSGRHTLARLHRRGGAPVPELHPLPQGAAGDPPGRALGGG